MTTENREIQTQYSTLGHMIETAAERWPQNPALVVDGRTYTYSELLERADLYRRGFESDGKFCGLLGRRDFPVFAGIVAALCGGRTYVPIATDDPLERQLDQILQLQMDLIIADHHCETELRALLVELSRPMTLILADYEERPDWCDAFHSHTFFTLADLTKAQQAPSPQQYNSDAYVLFTSGSTGKPKGVLVSHSNVLAYVSNFASIYGVDESDRFSQLAPLGFDFSVHDIFSAWRVGAATYVFEQGGAFQLARYFTDNRITVCGTVPSTALFLNRLNTSSANHFPDLRITVFCGEPLSERVAQVWGRAAPNCRIDNIYGPTETTVAVTYFPWHPTNGSDDRVVPIGWAFDGTRLRVADGKGDEVIDGETGELWIAGDQVTKGYWGSPALTAERFVLRDSDRWYRTGDLVKRSHGEGLLYLGRMDNQFQVLGQRIDRLEVETLLRQISGASDVAVIPWPVNEYNIVEGLAYFLEGCTHDEHTLRRMCREFMPKAMLPSSILICELPKNRNGKTNYHELQSILQERSLADRFGNTLPIEQLV